MRTGFITIGTLILLSSGIFYYVLKPTAITGTTTMLHNIFLGAMGFGIVLTIIGFLLPSSPQLPLRSRE